MVFAKLMVFAAGVYVGIFLDQRYKIPRVDDPQTLYQDTMAYIEQYRKEGGDKNK